MKTTEKQIDFRAEVDNLIQAGWPSRKLATYAVRYYYADQVRNGLSLDDLRRILPAEDVQHITDLR